MTIVCLGNSITCNWNELTYTDFWQEMLNKKYGKGKIRIINVGINGETVQDGYYRLHRDVIPYKPELVTVMFGHNDINYGIFPEVYRKYLKSIIVVIKQNTKAQVWLLTPNKVADEKEDKKYLSYIKVLKNVAKEKRAKLINVRKAFEGEDLNTIYTFEFDYDGLTGKDFIHPNKKGQRLIAKYLMKTFIDEFPNW